MKSDVVKIIADLKTEIQKDSSILLYQSSCKYHDSFQSIQSDIILLSSNEFPTNTKIGKVYCIKCDNNLLLKILFENNIKIETAVFIRDGCVEGGNYECTNRATYFGRLLPILREKCFVLTDHGTNDGFFDVPVEAIHRDRPKSYRFLVGHSDPISRPTFWEVKRCGKRPRTLDFGNIRLQLVHDSIFNYIETLDLAVFFSHKPSGFGHYFELDMSNDAFWREEIRGSSPADVFAEYQFKGEPRYIQISRNRSQTLERALNFAFDHKLERIGLIPFGWGRYERTYSELQRYSRKYPRDVVLFHLNKSDYSDLYSRPDCLIA
jgi:hypothetical protein